MPVRTFSISFVQVDFMADTNTFLSDVLRREYQNQLNDQRFTYETGDYAFQLSNITVRNEGASNESFHGVIHKLRLNNLPQLGSRDGSTDDIDLGDFEGVVEKNYFTFYRNRELLIYQNHREGTGMHDLTLFFSDLAGHTCSLNPVLKPEAYLRLINEDHPLTKIELSISKPNLELFNQEHSSDQFSRQLATLARTTNTHNIKITLGTPRNMATRISDTLKSSLAHLAGHSARTAKAWTENSSHPIDLIADRIKDQITVSMHGHYPNSNDMITAIEQARIRNSEDIANSLSEINHSDRTN